MSYTDCCHQLTCMHLSLVKSCAKEEVWDGRIVELSSSSSSGIWCREDRNMAAGWMERGGGGEGGGGSTMAMTLVTTIIATSLQSALKFTSS